MIAFFRDCSITARFIFLIVWTAFFATPVELAWGALALFSIFPLAFYLIFRNTAPSERIRGFMKLEVVTLMAFGIGGFFILITANKCALFTAPFFPENIVAWACKK